MLEVEIERLLAEARQLSARITDADLECQRLRAALREIAKGTEHPCAYCFEMATLARATLKEGEDRKPRLPEKAVSLPGAEVGEQDIMQQSADVAQMDAVGRLSVAIKRIAKLTKDRSEIAAATIKRCAQVVDDKAAEIEAWSHQNDASRLAAEMLRKAAAAIRTGER